ncbi:MAG: hypothetical protein K6T94_24625 [Paenibacillus sp.]|nr:hypothetical protein [Paenibacillus sp.]
MIFLVFLHSHEGSVRIGLAKLFRLPRDQILAELTYFSSAAKNYSTWKTRFQGHLSSAGNGTA